MSDPLRVLVVGAGAIGTYIGGSLALYRQAQVTFLVRRATAQALRQRGDLRLTLPDGTHRLPLALPSPTPVASGHPPTVGLLEDPQQSTSAAFDLVVLAVKTYHLPAFLKSIAPVRHAFPPVLCLLNGVEAEQTLAEFLGPERVLAGTVTSAVSRSEPGNARLEKPRGLGIALGHPLSATLLRACAQAHLNPRGYSNPAAMKWSKLLTNLTANATSAILDLPPAEIYAHPGLVRLEVAMLREALAVMAAQHLPVVDLPGAPVRRLAWALRHLPLAWLGPLLRRVVGGGRGEKMPSFHIDLYSGRGQTEVEALNGAVARYGARLGVPTPVNRWLTETLQALTTGQLPLGAYRHRPEALLAAWEGHSTPA